MVGRVGDDDEPTPTATPTEVAPAQQHTEVDPEVALAQTQPPSLTLAADACDPQ